MRGRWGRRWRMWRAGMSRCGRCLLRLTGCRCSACGRLGRGRRWSPSTWPVRRNCRGWSARPWGGGLTWPRRCRGGRTVPAGRPGTCAAVGAASHRVRWVVAAAASRDLSVAYAARRAGRVPSFAALPVRYADYAVWQRELLAGPAGQEQLDFWLEELRALPGTRSNCQAAARFLAVPSHRAGVLESRFPRRCMRVWRGWRVVLGRVCSWWCRRPGGAVVAAGGGTGCSRWGARWRGGRCGAG